MPAHRVRINPALLIWARESAGYSVASLADALEQPPATILDWESGQDRPTIRQLEKVASKVKRPLAAFFLPQPPSEDPVPEDFRTLPSSRLGHFEPETLLAFRRARNARQVMLELVEPAAPRLPTCTVEDNAEEAAAEMRVLLGIGVEEQLKWRDAYQAFGRWRDALEATGTLVLQLPFPRADVRAFALQDDIRLPVIAVTSKDSVEARIFSLLHESGHLLLGSDTASCTPSSIEEGRARHARAIVERWCNTFAAAALLPRTGQISTLLEHVAHAESLEVEVKAAARKCRVSRFVVLGRLHTWGLIEDSRFWRIFHDWSESSEAFESGGGGGDYYRNKLAEKGKRYTSTVLEALNGGHINDFEAAEYLECRPDHIEGLRNLLHASSQSDE